MSTSIGVIHLHFLLPGCASLKEKRGRIKPLLARLHREFNLSTAEVSHQDKWQESLVACTVVSNDAVHNRQALQEVLKYIEHYFPDLQLVDHQIELV